MKIKKISFQPEFIPLIKSGKKTVTRRIKKKDPGIYYFTGGRNGKKEGYIEITKSWEIGLLRSFGLCDIFPPEPIRYGTLIEIEMEGFTHIHDFIKCWDKLVPKKYQWPKYRAEELETIDPEIWRMQFKYLGEKL